MNSKFFTLKDLPIVFSLIVLILTIPLVIFAISQSQDIRNHAAEPETFPNVDLNNDGVVNNIDLKIYLEKFAKTPLPNP